MWLKPILEVLIPLAFLLVPLLLTWLIEWLVVWLMGLRERKTWLVVLLVNVITNPTANVMMLLYGSRHYFKFGVTQYNYPLIAGIEIAVVVVEMLLLMYAFRLRPARAFYLSFVINLTSFLVGACMWLLMTSYIPNFS